MYNTLAIRSVLIQRAFIEQCMQLYGVKLNVNRLVCVCKVNTEKNRML